MDVSEQIEQSKIRGHKFIDNYAYSIKSFVRVVTDKEIKFPLNHQIINHNSLMEVSHLNWDECPNKGWGKPDKKFIGIEIFYLWKQFKTNF